MLRSPRITYIDAIRGFSILWVVAFHLELPEWLSPPYRMPLFFFVSGLFFKPLPTKQFIERRLNSLFVPFVFWLLVGATLWVGQRLAEAQWAQIPLDWRANGVIYVDVLKIFKISYVADSVRANVPLWFLIALFNVQIIYFVLRRKVSLWWILTPIVVIIYLAGLVLEQHGINGLFLMSATCTSLVFYALGNIAGGHLCQALNHKNYRLYMIVFFGMLLATFIVLGRYIDCGGLAASVLKALQSLCFIPLVFVAFHYMERWSISTFFVFLGRNTVVILATHCLIFEIVNTINRHLGYERWVARLVMALLIVPVSYWGILFCNRYLPWAVGKGRIIKIN